MTDIRRILFVCTGNTCRSPLAERLLLKKAVEAGVALTVRSAGLAAVDGQSMSKHSQRVLEERGADSAGFRSSALRREAVEWADVILTMTTSHKRALVGTYAEAADKVYTLMEYAGQSEGGEDALQEWERLVSELQVKQALNEPITAEEEARYAELQARIPNPDVPDPFGGDLETYRFTANEIEAAIDRILERWKS